MFPRGVRVRAHLVSRLDDLHGLLRVLNMGKGHVELDGDLEPSLLGREQTHPAVDRHVGDVDLLTAAHGSEGTSKQAAYPTAKSCSGLVPPPSPPISLGVRSWTSRAPSACPSMTVCTATRHGCLGGVENSGHVGLLLSSLGNAVRRRLDPEARLRRAARRPCGRGSPALREVELVESVLNASGDLFNCPGSVDLDEEPSSLVVLEEWLCVFRIDLLAEPDGLDRVVGP